MFEPTTIGIYRVCDNLFGYIWIYHTVGIIVGIRRGIYPPVSSNVASWEIHHKCRLRSLGNASN
jgi:hypothetical protein